MNKYLYQVPSADINTNRTSINTQGGMEMDPIVGAGIGFAGNTANTIIGAIMAAAAKKEEERRKLLQEALQTEYKGKQSAVDTTTQGTQNALANLINSFSGKLR